jgi:serine/threonine-protein kinase RsbW
MEKCEYSELTLPNDPSYVQVALSYVRQIAAKLGFDERDQTGIQAAVAEAVGNVIQHAFSPSERTDFQISCERAPLGLQIVVKDAGLPADPQRIQECLYEESEPTSPCKGISVMKENMDEVAFHNNGPEGKEIVLVKYLKNRDIADYERACNLQPYGLPSGGPAFNKQIEFTVKEIEPSEAVEISRTVYRAYGYSYAYEHAYYPERLAELIRSKAVYIAAAVTPEGEIAGHCALIRKENAPKIAELGLGAVKPQFRSQGIFTRLTGHLIEKAREEGLMGVFGEAVTNHTFSQRTGHSLGLRDCALLVGYIPVGTSFKGITEQLPQRESLVAHFLYLNKPKRLIVHPPERHEDMVLRLYRNVGVAAEVGESKAFIQNQGESLVSIAASRSKDSAEIFIRRYGANIVRDVRARLRDLCLKHTAVVYLYLDLGDPATGVYCRDFEELGFFFSGILPGGCPGDALILQYLNNVAIDYDKIRLASDTAVDLASYIRRLDPNARGD